MNAYRPRWWIVGALVVLILTGCTAETSRTDANDAVDADAGDVTDDADADEARDSSDASDEDAFDGDNDNNENNGNNGQSWKDEPDWVDCDCAHPDDKCSPQYCGRPGIACGEGEECPDGYICHDGSLHTPFCICDGESEACGPYCETQEDCPSSSQSCDWDDEVCRLRSGCISDLQCSEGTICGQMRAPGEGVCYQSGDAQEGDPCDTDFDCVTGLCRDDICQEQCLSDGDCQEGKHCVEFLELQGSQTVNGCKNTDGSDIECTVSCDDDQRCRANYCLPQWCVRSDDCENADCVDQGQMFPGECEQHPDEDEDYVCKPEEFRSSSGDACILPEPCWKDDDCGEPYECSFGGSCVRDIDDEVPS